MTESTYPELLSEDPADLAKVLREIVRLRNEDIGNHDDLKNRYVAGRKVGKVPADADDVDPSDRPGDFNYDADYLYYALEISAGVVKWGRVPVTTTNPWADIIDGIVSPEALAVFREMNVQPTPQRKILIDAVIRKLDDAGIWDKLDVLYVFAAHTEQAALLNWKSPGTYTGTNISATAFSADVGFTGDGSADYIDTGWSPSSNGVQFTLDSAHIGVFVMTASTNTGPDIGVPGSANLRARVRTGTEIFQVNSTGSFTTTNTDDYPAHAIAVRRDSASHIGFINGIQVGSDTDVSGSIPSGHLVVGQANAVFSDRQWSIAHAGAALSDDEALELYEIFRWYLEQVNAIESVVPAFENRYLHIRDEKAANTAGGTFTSGAWQTRTLNTVTTNQIAGASLSSNQITLPAGSYRVRARAPGYEVALHKAKFYNITDSSDVVIGSSGRSPTGCVTDSFVIGEFTITSQKVFEFQHRCSVTGTTTGFGIASNFSVVEVYAEVEIWKVA